MRADIVGERYISDTIGVEPIKYVCPVATYRQLDGPEKKDTRMLRKYFQHNTLLRNCYLFC